MSQLADSLIHATWVVTVDPDFRILEEHCVVIQAGQIVDLLPSQAVAGKWHCPSAQEQRLTGQALMPGLINTHTHAAMSLLRGIADDLALMPWLEQHIWPAESRWVDPEFIADGTRLALAEMIRSGTTCMNDMYFFPDVTAQVCAGIGMRASVGLIVLDFPTVWAQNSDDYFHKGLALYNQLKHDNLLQCTLAPHAPYTVGDDNLKRVATLANELELRVHMHVHETEFEVTQAQQQAGQRPLQRLQQLNLLNEQLLAVHMTQLTQSEIQMLAESGAHVLHCPESNLKLASGFCPIAELQAAGVNVTLGTDGAASNNDLDLLGEMRTAALLAKGVAADASAIPAAEAIRMATINGAKALGMDDRIGSIEIGKSADLISIDLHTLNSQPLFKPSSQIVYSAASEQVRNVWIAGKQQLLDGELLHIDRFEVLEKAKYWQQKIAS